MSITRPPGLRVHTQPERHRKGDSSMPRYLISFDDGSMDHIPEEDWPTVGEASRAVVRGSSRRALGSSAAGFCVSRRASCRPTGRSLTAPSRRPRPWSAASRSSKSPHATRRSSGRPRSPSPADVPKRYARSRTTRSPRPRPVVDRAPGRRTGFGYIRRGISLGSGLWRASVARERPEKPLQTTGGNVTRVRFPPPP